MKKIISAVAALALIAACCAPAFAEYDAKTVLGNTLQSVKTVFESSFSLPDDDYNKQYPDVWYLYPLRATGNTGNEDYAFLKPSYDVSEPEMLDSNTLMKAVLSDLLSNKKPAQATVDALASGQGENGAFRNSYGYDSVAESAYAAIALELSAASGVKNSYSRAKLLSYLYSQQKADGGFNDYGDCGNVDTTGMVMSALDVIGTDSAYTIMKECVAYMNSVLQPDGSLVGKGEYDSANSCSQSMGVIGLIAAGYNLDSGTFARVDDKLYDYIGENGCFWYDEASMNGVGWYAEPDMFSTCQAMMALSDLAYGNMNPTVSGTTATVTTAVTAPTTAGDTTTETSTSLASRKYPLDMPDFNTAMAYGGLFRTMVNMFTADASNAQTTVLTSTVPTAVTVSAVISDSTAGSTVNNGAASDAQPKPNVYTGFLGIHPAVWITCAAAAVVIAAATAYTVISNRKSR